MAENEKEAYLALIAAHDPEIRTLLDQGFDFVTNAFKAGAAPSGMKAAPHHSTSAGHDGGRQATLSTTECASRRAAAATVTGSRTPWR